MPTLWRNTTPLFMVRENKIGKVADFVEEVWG